MPHLLSKFSARWFTLAGYGRGPVGRQYASRYISTQCSLLRCTALSFPHVQILGMLDWQCRTPAEFFAGPLGARTSPEPRHPSFSTLAGGERSLSGSATKPKAIAQTSAQLFGFSRCGRLKHPQSTLQHLPFRQFIRTDCSGGMGQTAPERVIPSSSSAPATPVSPNRPRSISHSPLPSPIIAPPSYMNLPHRSSSTSSAPSSSNVRRKLASTYRKPPSTYLLNSSFVLTLFRSFLTAGFWFSSSLLVPPS
ncbi:hypothetical protein BDN72DRAFT_904130 [Pluteus cervinus]|uniref:Uncharacterized protein n=1 Tax=Pluteus cervinus TaxID=181527 RepID=A0ACD3A6B4_9AGAR|nr:hypothetical protein BDN72DRAFT_904130 [Pluteus cervinus]